MMRRLPPVASAGLTTSVTAYTSGDALGTTAFVFPNAVDTIGGRGMIRGAILTDAAHVIGAVDAFLYRDIPAATVDNSIPQVSVADQAKLIGAVSLTTIQAGSVSNAVSTPSAGCWVPYDCLGTTLYAILVTRSGNSFFVAATDLALSFLVDVGPYVE